MLRKDDLADLLSSNTVPNPLETLSIQSIIGSLTTKISELRSQLVELEEELRIHQAVLSPVRKLPPEILGEVFGLSIQLPLDSEGRSQLLDLCLVCKAWRHATILTNGLWSGISVSEHSMSVKKVTEWLSRAGGAPKVFGFIADSYNGCWQDSDMVSSESPCRHTATGVVKMLTNGPALDHLSLDCMGPQCLRNVLDALRVDDTYSGSKTRPWDTVKSLSLKFRSLWNEPPNPSDSLFLQIPSSVTSFDLHLPVMTMQLPDTMAVPLHLPPGLLQRLTSFSMHSDWEGNHVSTVLKDCLNIEELTLDSIYYLTSPNFSPGDSGIVLPKLRTLRLQNLSPCNFNIFSILTTPVLKTLDIHLAPNSEGNPLDTEGNQFVRTIHDFIKWRSKCQDTFCSLSVRSAYTGAKVLIRLIEGLPSITHLTFDHIDFVKSDSRLFYFLRPRALPRLETLELLNVSRSGVPNFWFLNLVSYIKSRRNLDPRVPPEDGEFVPPDSLKKVVFTYRPETRVLEHRLEVSEDVKMLQKTWGISVSIGPFLYRVGEGVFI